MAIKLCNNLTFISILWADFCKIFIYKVSQILARVIMFIYEVSYGLSYREHLTGKQPERTITIMIYEIPDWSKIIDQPSSYFSIRFVWFGYKLLGSHII